MHTFPTNHLAEPERCRRVAEWLESAVLDLKRAQDLTPDPEMASVVVLVKAKADALRAKAKTLLYTSEK